MRRRGADAQTSIDRLARRVEELERELARRTPPLPAGAPGWQETDAAAGGADAPVSYRWLSLLEPPVRRRRRLPRLPFEMLFLVACAVATGVADLEPLRIAAVMGAAWVLVALTEWSATAADRRRDRREAAPPPALVPVVSQRPDRSWYIPPVEQTIAQGAFSDPAAVTHVQAQEPGDGEATMEHRLADAQG